MPSVTDRCSAQLPNGTFCDEQSIPGDPPFPICPRHIRQAYQWADDWMRSGGIPADPETIARVKADIAANQPEASPEVVYYLRIGDLVKIGTTINLAMRLRNYPPHTELLAVEPGGREIEAVRLRQFNALLASRVEWFHYREPLISHVSSLRSGGKRSA